MWVGGCILNIFLPLACSLTLFFSCKRDTYDLIPFGIGIKSASFHEPKLLFLVAYHQPCCILALKLLIHGEVIHCM